jgi:hypothetical protein
MQARCHQRITTELYTHFSETTGKISMETILPKFNQRDCGVFRQPLFHYRCTPASQPYQLEVLAEVADVDEGRLSYARCRQRGRSVIRQFSVINQLANWSVILDLLVEKQLKKEKKCYWRIKAQQTVAVYLYCRIVRRVCQRMLVGFRSQFLFQNFVNDNLYLHSSPIDYAS